MVNNSPTLHLMRSIIGERARDENSMDEQNR